MLNEISDFIPRMSSFENGEPLCKESFNFLSQMGSGSFGKVYKVASKCTNNIYALKVLSKNQINSLKLADQLRNEIMILARCEHPNIVKLNFAFEDKGYVYLVMELVNEGTLYQKLKQLKRLSESQTAEYLTDIIRAVQYLHSLDPPIIHRDLKPENVLMTGDTLKIADFGWSNVKDEPRNTFCGTPDYLSPEMILGSGHSEKLDIWTLGVMMFEMLHGRAPFTPKEKTKEKRMLQRTIEDNIVNGKIEFDEEISNEARVAILAMLNPVDKLRPRAADLFQLEFFIKHGKTLIAHQEHLTKQQSSALIGHMSLKQKVDEYEKRLEHLFYNNKCLSELCEQKDKLIEDNNQRIDLLNKQLIHSVT